MEEPDEMDFETDGVQDLDEIFCSDCLYKKEGYRIINTYHGILQESGIQKVE